jgi:hypothetical protein
MSQCSMRRSEWPLKVAPETIDRRDGQPMCMIAWMRSKSPESQNLLFPRKRPAVNAYSWPHRKRCGDRLVLVRGLSALNLEAISLNTLVVTRKRIWAGALVNLPFQAVMQV